MTARRLPILLSALAGAFVLACSPPPAPGDAHAAAPADERPAQTAEVMLRVDGMTCAACEKTIRSRVQEEAGIVSCTVDHAAGTAHVTYDAAKIQPEAISAAIRDAGYEVK